MLDCRLKLIEFCMSGIFHSKLVPMKCMTYLESTGQSDKFDCKWNTAVCRSYLLLMVVCFPIAVIKLAQKELRS
jgi:hypothetical protein